jgi:hypothetical protein
MLFFFIFSGQFYLIHAFVLLREIIFHPTGCALDYLNQSKGNQQIVIRTILSMIIIPEKENEHFIRIKMSAT